MKLVYMMQVMYVCDVDEVDEVDVNDVGDVGSRRWSWSRRRWCRESRDVMDKMTSWIWLQFFGKASRISFREKSPSAYPRNSSLQEAKRLTGKNCSIFLLMRCPSCSVMPLHWVFKSINLRKSNICIHPVCWKIVRSSSYASAWTIMGHLVEVVGWWLAHTPCLGVKKWQLQPHRTIFLGNGMEWCWIWPSLLYSGPSRNKTWWI